MKKLTIALLLGCGALLLLRPDTASAAVREGLGLCARTVIPSLFPFFVVTSLLLQLGLADELQRLAAPFMGPLFRLRGVCAMPVLTGLVGGYPTGAKTAAELYEQGQITRREAELLLGFCDNCGPAFLVSYVGASVLGSSRAGAWLYLIHVFAALVTGMILCRAAPERGPALLPGRMPAKQVTFSRALTDAVSGALTSSLHICAFVVVFTVLTALLPEGTPAAAAGVLEMVSGVSGLTASRAGFVTAAAVVGWGGLSVHCQAMSAAAPAGVSMRWHWIGKAVQSAVSAAAAAGMAIWMFPA